MCGICGFTFPQGNFQDTLQSMCDVIAHRGPDGEGQYYDDGIALGHRRLSLIDLEGGNQPMVRSTGEKSAKVTSPAKDSEGNLCESRENALQIGDWAIVFNGEIYNYQDLRKELEQEGWEFSTNSDTEVLLVGYIARKEAILHQLRGMFAFAIWNKQTQELFCARDFFGIKPFYYTFVDLDVPKDSQTTARRFVFGSEIKSILEHSSVKKELNESALSSYLCFQFPVLHETFFKGIFKLPQGYFIKVDKQGNASMQRYWKPEFHIDDTRTREEVANKIDEVMRDSVRYHNVADVEVGSLLSSGIDSSYMAACLTEENPDIHTFTVGFSEFKDEKDEIAWAKELAEKLKVHHDYLHIKEEDYWDSVSKVIWHMDEPLSDPSAFALYFVDKIAAKKVKAILSGEGADELFGGYRLYQASLANKKIDWLPSFLLKGGSKVLSLFNMRGADYLDRASKGVRRWYYTNANGVIFTPKDREKVFNSPVQERLRNVRYKDACEAIGLIPQNGDNEKASYPKKSTPINGMPLPSDLTEPIYREAADVDEVSQMQYADMWFWLVGDILLKSDKMAMAHSLEARVPFLDKEVFNLACTIPVSQKLDETQTKLTLRDAAMRAIPSDWANKQKLGFPVPLSKWLMKDQYYDRIKKEFSSEIAEQYFNVEYLVQLLDDHKAGARDNTRKIWIIYSFLVWYKIFFLE